MSFDIFLQRFRDRDGADADSQAVASALAPFLVTSQESGHPVLRVGEGEADVYGLDDLATGFMVNRCAPEVLTALVAVATACDLVILPVGCPTAIIDPGQRVHLPEVLSADAVHITSGADLRRLIESR